MYHLAQLNIGKLRHPIDHPEIAEFAANLDRINTLAETSPGFVWRLKDESGNATDIDVFGNPLIIVNMSVWETLQDLKDFVFKSGHMEILKNATSGLRKCHRPTWSYGGSKKAISQP